MVRRMGVDSFLMRVYLMPSSPGAELGFLMVCSLVKVSSRDISSVSSVPGKEGVNSVGLLCM